MKQMINVTLSLNGEVFLACNYLWLDPYAPNTGRKFVFSGIQSRKEISLHDKIITVSITAATKFDSNDFLNEFKIFVFDYAQENLVENEWWIYGEVNNEGYPEYKQGRIDVFNDWQKGTLFDWFSIPIGSQLKLDYLGVCLMYSGLAINIVEKQVYQFDVQLVMEERDFFYMAAMEFIGDRGYFGHDLHTFKDCLLELYNHNGYFSNKRIVLLGMDNLLNPEVASFLQIIKEEFLRFKFVVE